MIVPVGCSPNSAIAPPGRGAQRSETAPPARRSRPTASPNPQRAASLSLGAAHRGVVELLQDLNVRCLQHSRGVLEQRLDTPLTVTPSKSFSNLRPHARTLALSASPRRRIPANAQRTPRSSSSAATLTPTTSASAHHLHAHITSNLMQPIPIAHSPPLAPPTLPCTTTHLLHHLPGSIRSPYYSHLSPTHPHQPHPTTSIPQSPFNSSPHPTPPPPHPTPPKTA